MPKTVKLKDPSITTDSPALPSLPERTQKVLNLLSDQSVSVEKLKRLISEDQALSARILNIANFSFYGGGKTIPGLTQAIMGLGFNAVRNIVVALALKDVFMEFGQDEQLVWERMMGSAIASSIIARHTKLTGPEDAFMGGLLHDVGRICLINEDPEGFRRALAMSEAQHVSLDEAAAEFGLNPRHTGALIVKKWGFPDTLVNVVKNFDNPDELLKERFMFNLVSIIAFADAICDKLGIGCKGPRDVDLELANLRDSLGVADGVFKSLVDNIRAAFSQGIKLY